MLSSFVVLFSDGPENIRLDPSATNYTKNSGDVLPDITCRVDCSPSCSPAWTKNGASIPTQSATLSLGNLDPVEAGNYRCTASRDSNTVSENLTVNVIRKYSSV